MPQGHQTSSPTDIPLGAQQFVIEITVAAGASLHLRNISARVRPDDCVYIGEVRDRRATYVTRWTTLDIEEFLKLSRRKALRLIARSPCASAYATSTTLTARASLGACTTVTVIITPTARTQREADHNGATQHK